jgi:hypothetical protein
MPFTLSHAAAVLPLYGLSKSRLPLSALVIGSMAPDFAYFTPLDFGLASHSIAGLFWFCWPAGLVAWLVYVRLLERPTIALLPDAWRAQLSPFDESISVSVLARVSIALLLGAATHIVWDSFTHATSPVVAATPALRAVVLQINGSPVRVYNVLQHLSTIVGFLVLAFSAYSKLRTRRQATLSRSAQVYAASAPAITNTARIGAVIVLLVSSWTSAIANYLLYSHSGLEHRLVHFALGGMSGWAVAWCVVALLIMWKWRSETWRPAHLRRQTVSDK